MRSYADPQLSVVSDSDTIGRVSWEELYMQQTVRRASRPISLKSHTRGVRCDLSKQYGGRSHSEVRRQGGRCDLGSPGGSYWKVGGPGLTPFSPARHQTCGRSRYGLDSDNTLYPWDLVGTTSMPRPPCLQTLVFPPEAPERSAANKTI